MKTGLAAVAGLALASLGGCIIVDAEERQIISSFDAGPGYGTVFAASVIGNTVNFQVSDNGCTDNGFFDVTVVEEDDDEFQVGLRRTRDDHCKALNPEGTTVSWTFSELGIPDGAEVSILNRVRR